MTIPYIYTEQEKLVISIFEEKEKKTGMELSLVTAAELQGGFLDILRINMQNLMNKKLIMHMGNTDKGIPVYIYVRDYLMRREGKSETKANIRLT